MSFLTQYPLLTVHILLWKKNAESLKTSSSPILTNKYQECRKIAVSAKLCGM